jgi:hypothetical protein
MEAQRKRGAACRPAFCFSSHQVLQVDGGCGIDPRDEQKVATADVLITVICSTTGSCAS